MIRITHPNRHSLAAEEHVEMVWVRDKTLKAYFKEAKLVGLKTHCRVDVTNEHGYFQRIRSSYVPKDGDVIRLRRVRSAG